MIKLQFKDSIDRLDGKRFGGLIIRVEQAKSNRGGSSNTMRSRFRVKIRGLSSRVSWQDLKDHMRSAGDVVYTDVLGRGMGVAEYSNIEDMK